MYAGCQFYTLTVAPVSKVEEEAFLDMYDDCDIPLDVLSSLLSPSGSSVTPANFYVNEDGGLACAGDTEISDAEAEEAAPVSLGRGQPSLSPTPKVFSSEGRVSGVTHHMNTGRNDTVHYCPWTPPYTWGLSLDAFEQPSQRFPTQAREEMPTNFRYFPVASQIFTSSFTTTSSLSIALSILVNSMRTSRVKISATNSQTVLSSGFVSSLSVPHPPGSSFTLTINGGPHGSFTTVLPCAISTSMPLDVCLGSDWTSCIREWWTQLGFVGDFNAADHLHAVDVAQINACHAPVVTMPVPSANPYLASM
ncbi:hypothetical protein B0H10DRAFT_2189714 [Mycena sp. CBHHK59/15]|nr:hypothetical protein B0H10DRAFT_2189714 [Mycena sp. CBHHK59/15]